MAKPRVFVSSTYYDLKHIRSSLDLFIESLGFEPILSEKGDIAYSPDKALDESCYREAASADIFVLIVGGRYGSETSGQGKVGKTSFFDRYESITRKEFDVASAEDIPTYVVIENGVYCEYQTYLRNKESTGINYAHVDSINVFRLIEDVLAKHRNNPVFTFEHFSQIQDWLRDQWSGYFRELLKSRVQQRQFSALSIQVGELKAVNETLKKYLEALMKGIDSDQSASLIQLEDLRLEAFKVDALKTNDWCTFIAERCGVAIDAVVDAIRRAKDAVEFAHLMNLVRTRDEENIPIEQVLAASPSARHDYNAARGFLGLPPISDWGLPVFSPGGI